MGIVAELLQNVCLPKMVRARQNFPATEVADIDATLRSELRRPEIAARVKPGMRVAVAVGSRGVADLPRLVHIVVDELKTLRRPALL